MYNYFLKGYSPFTNCKSWSYFPFMFRDIFIWYYVFD